MKDTVTFKGTGTQRVVPRQGTHRDTEINEVKGIKDYTEANAVTVGLTRKDTGNRMKLIPTVLLFIFLLRIVGTYSVIDDYKRSVLKFNTETPPRLTLRWDL